MKQAGIHVKLAISELKDCVSSSCPNELAMRTTMALIQLSNAFMEAGLMPLEMVVPMHGPTGDAIEGYLMTWRAGRGDRRRIMLGADPVTPQPDLFGATNTTPGPAGA